MGERVCAWCGAEMRASRSTRKFCGSRCKDKSRYEKRYGVPPGPFCESRMCLICGAAFVARTATRKYCSAGCRRVFQARSNKMASANANRLARSQNPQKFRMRDKERRANNPDRFKEMARTRYAKVKASHPDRHREMLRKQAESERRRNAARALSILLMPTHQHPAE